MTKISSDQFKGFSDASDAADAGINVNDLSTETKAKLTKAGVSATDLKKIAGPDGQIKGQAEYSRLFTYIDQFDRDSSDKTFVAKDDAGVETKSGAVYEALKSELDRNIAKAQNRGVIHLGMRKESKLEADALEKSNPAKNGGVERIKGYESKGEITYDGKKYDLTGSAGLEKFRDALISGPDKMPKAQAQKFIDVLGKQDTTSRDELAQLGTKFFQMGEGKSVMNRLVISGHGWDGEISGDGSGMFRLSDVEDLAKVFPKGAEKIEHVAVSACFCSGETHFNTLRSAFPNLKSAFAYNAYSPKAEQGAPQHMQAWEGMTDGDDPSQVDPKFTKTATWNIADGNQGLEKNPLPKLIKEADDNFKIYEDYSTGKKTLKKGQKDPQLDRYYELLAKVIQHPDIDPKDKKSYERLRADVYKFRHPN